ncbi:hypothetical protein HDU97_001419 [Phlyctochytrium planicorne]|nr:hypothetical protein HDU97_001419 [Phlyctochytrium planicorne]
MQSPPVESMMTTVDQNNFCLLLPAQGAKSDVVIKCVGQINASEHDRLSDNLISSTEFIKTPLELLLTGKLDINSSSAVSRIVYEDTRLLSSTCAGFDRYVQILYGNSFCIRCKKYGLSISGDELQQQPADSTGEDPGGSSSNATQTLPISKTTNPTPSSSLFLSDTLEPLPPVDPTEIFTPVTSNERPSFPGNMRMDLFLLLVGVGGFVVLCALIGLLLASIARRRRRKRQILAGAEDPAKPRNPQPEAISNSNGHDPNVNPRKASLRDLESSNRASSRTVRPSQDLVPQRKGFFGGWGKGKGKAVLSSPNPASSHNSIELMPLDQPFLQAGTNAHESVNLPTAMQSGGVNGNGKFYPSKSKSLASVSKRAPKIDTRQDSLASRSQRGNSVKSPIGSALITGVVQRSSSAPSLKSVTREGGNGVAPSTVRTRKLSEDSRRSELAEKAEQANYRYSFTYGYSGYPQPSNMPWQISNQQYGMYGLDQQPYPSSPTDISSNLRINTTPSIRAHGVQRRLSISQSSPLANDRESLSRHQQQAQQAQQQQAHAAYQQQQQQQYYQQQMYALNYYGYMQHRQSFSAPRPASPTENIPLAFEVVPRVSSDRSPMVIGGAQRAIDAAYDPTNQLHLSPSHGLAFSPPLSPPLRSSSDITASTRNSYDPASWQNPWLPSVDGGASPNPILKTRSALQLGKETVSKNLSAKNSMLGTLKAASVHSEYSAEYEPMQTSPVLEEDSSDSIDMKRSQDVSLSNAGASKPKAGATPHINRMERKDQPKISPKTTSNIEPISAAVESCSPVVSTTAGHNTSKKRNTSRQPETRSPQLTSPKPTKPIFYLADMDSETSNSEDKTSSSINAIQSTICTKPAAKLLIEAASQSAEAKFGEANSSKRSASVEEFRPNTQQSKLENRGRDLAFEQDFRGGDEDIAHIPTLNHSSAAHETSVKDGAQGSDGHFVALIDPPSSSVGDFCKNYHSSDENGVERPRLPHAEKTPGRKRSASKNGSVVSNPESAEITDGKRFVIETEGSPKPLANSLKRTSSSINRAGKKTDLNSSVPQGDSMVQGIFSSIYSIVGLNTGGEKSESTTAFQPPEGNSPTISRKASKNSNARETVKSAASNVTLAAASLPAPAAKRAIDAFTDAVGSQLPKTVAIAEGKDEKQRGWRTSFMQRLRRGRSSDKSNPSTDDEEASSRSRGTSSHSRGTSTHSRRASAHSQVFQAEITPPVEIDVNIEEAVLPPTVVRTATTAGASSGWLAPWKVEGRNIGSDLDDDTSYPSSSILDSSQPSPDTSELDLKIEHSRDASVKSNNTSPSSATSSFSAVSAFTSLSVDQASVANSLARPPVAKSSNIGDKEPALETANIQTRELSPNMAAGKLTALSLGFRDETKQDLSSVEATSNRFGLSDAAPIANAIEATQSEEPLHAEESMGLDVSSATITSNIVRDAPNDLELGKSRNPPESGLNDQNEMIAFATLTHNLDGISEIAIGSQTYSGSEAPSIAGSQSLDSDSDVVSSKAGSNSRGADKKPIGPLIADQVGSVTVESEERAAGSAKNSAVGTSFLTSEIGKEPLAMHRGMNDFTAKKKGREQFADAESDSKIKVGSQHSSEAANRQISVSSGTSLQKPEGDLMGSTVITSSRGENSASNRHSTSIFGDDPDSKIASTQVWVASTNALHDSSITNGSLLGNKEESFKNAENLASSTVNAVRSDQSKSLPKDTLSSRAHAAEPSVLPAILPSADRSIPAAVAARAAWSAKFPSGEVKKQGKVNVEASQLPTLANGSAKQEPKSVEASKKFKGDAVKGNQSSLQQQADTRTNVPATVFARTSLPRPTTIIQRRQLNPSNIEGITGRGFYSAPSNAVFVGGLSSVTPLSANSSSSSFETVVDVIEDPATLNSLQRAAGDEIGLSAKPNVVVAAAESESRVTGHAMPPLRNVKNSENFKKAANSASIITSSDASGKKISEKETKKSEGKQDQDGEEESWRSSGEKGVDEWNTMDVVAWLHSIGLRSDIIDAFKGREIDGKKLVSLTDSSLSELGIARSGLKRSILMNIRALS